MGGLEGIDTAGSCISYASRFLHLANVLTVVILAAQGEPVQKYATTSSGCTMVAKAIQVDEIEVVCSKKKCKQLAQTVIRKMKRYGAIRNKLIYKSG